MSDIQKIMCCRFEVGFNCSKSSDFWKELGSFDFLRWKSRYAVPYDGTECYHIFHVFMFDIDRDEIEKLVDLLSEKEYHYYKVNPDGSQKYVFNDQFADVVIETKNITMGSVYAGLVGSFVVVFCLISMFISPVYWVVRHVIGDISLNLLVEIMAVFGTCLWFAVPIGLIIESIINSNVLYSKTVIKNVYENK